MTSDVKSSTIPNDSISKSRSNISSATVSFNGIQLTHNDFYNNFVDLFHTFPELCPLDKPKVSDLLQMPDGSRRSSNTSALWYIAKDIINHKTSSTRLTFRKDGDFSSSPILMIRNKDNFISYTFIHGTIFHDIIFIDGVLNSIENSRCGTNFCKDNKESLSIIVSSRESCEVFVRYCRSPPNEIVIDTWISRDLITSENITSFILTRDELERVFKNKMTTYLFVNKIKITHIVYRESGVFISKNERRFIRDGREIIKLDNIEDYVKFGALLKSKTSSSIGELSIDLKDGDFIPAYSGKMINNHNKSDDLSFMRYWVNGKVVNNYLDGSYKMLLSHLQIPDVIRIVSQYLILF